MSLVPEYLRLRFAGSADGRPKAGDGGDDDDANLAVENGRYRIKRVYSGEKWNPFLQAPLAQPGQSAADGEYILAVNGNDLTADQNIFAALQGTVGEQVMLRVGPSPDGSDARDIVVERLAE